MLRLDAVFCTGLSVKLKQFGMNIGTISISLIKSFHNC